MEPIEIEIPALNIEKAIKALQDCTKELKEQGSEELTDKQAKALVRFLEGLFSPDESET
jgi:cytochrome c1